MNNLETLNRTINDTMRDRLEGDGMTAKLDKAKAFDTLARDSELIDLEARCRTADALERIAAALEYDE